MAVDDVEHVPVLVDELVESLDLRQSDTVIDATFGAGGHARRVLRRLGPDGRLIGFERDPEVFRRSRRRFRDEPRVQLHRVSYRRMDERVGDDVRADAVYFDLGLSSFHLESSGRGFSFQRPDEPLDCRFDPDSASPSARELIRDRSPDQLVEQFREYGEVRRAPDIARRIDARRPVETVGDLRACVRALGVPPEVERGELARVFQALRIAVNDELDHLEEGLEAAFGRLVDGGRMAVLAYHSLEDKRVKGFFRRTARDCVCPPDFPVCACEAVQRCRRVTRSPVMPGEEETQQNPRARSARLRVVERCDGAAP